LRDIVLGDVFIIKTPNGKAYLQYVYKDETLGEMIRVLSGLYNCEIINLEESVKENELYIIFFPLKAAYKRNIVEYVGQYSIPNGFQKPRFMRVDNVDRNGQMINWHLLILKRGKYNK